MLKKLAMSVCFSLISSIAAAETLTCSLRDHSQFGSGFIPPDAMIVLSGDKATYRDFLTHNILGEDVTVVNRQNKKRLQFKYSVQLELERGGDHRVQYSVTYIKSTKVLSMSAVLSGGYDNEIRGTGRCR